MDGWNQSEIPYSSKRRQGGVLSTHLYKVYINSVLHEFNRSQIGMKIGNIYVGSPTCADDMALLTDNSEDMQIMLNTALGNSRQDRVTIHPTKTNAVVLSKGKTVEKNLKWELGNNIVTPTDQTKHLGTIRSEIKENEINIEDRLTLARRTLYLLINNGVHGSNGINPIISYKIYQSYVLPRLLFGLEIMPLRQIDLNRLKKFHNNCLRRFQSLSQRTALCAVHLLIGAFPIEAEIHKKQWSFLHGLLCNDNQTIQRLNQRQIIINIDNPESFYCVVTKTLEHYNLPNIKSLMEEIPNKLSWKHQYKTAVNNYWTKFFRDESENRSTLQFMNFNETQIEKPHLLWQNIGSSVTEVKRSITVHTVG